MKAYPRLPVLGWSAFSGARSTTAPGVWNIANRRYTTSGRAAIALALRALKIRPGDKVLVPTYHCQTMIAPVVNCGAQPLFYPVLDSGGLDFEWLEKADLTDARAILAAHYFGIPQPMSKLRAFCDAHRIALIEDCAHAFFGLSDGFAVGSWGDFAIASLPKFFPVPEGGLLLSAKRSMEKFDLGFSWRDEIKAAADAVEIGVMHDRFPGLRTSLGSIFRVKNRWRRSPDSGVAPTKPVGERAAYAGDSRLDALRPTFTARLISANVFQSRIVEGRRRNYMALTNRLSHIDGARALRPALPEMAAPYVFPLYVDEPMASYQRLRSAGVPIFRWDEIWPGTPILDGDRGLDWADHVFQLGCHQDLSLQDVENIASTVEEIIRK